MKLIIVIILAVILRETNGELPNCFSNVINGVKNAANSFYDAGKSIVTSYTNLAQATYGSFQRLTKETANMLQSAVNEVTSGVTCFVKKTQRSFENVVGTLTSLVEGAGSGAANGAIKRLIENIKVIEGMIGDALKQANEVYKQQIQKINGTITKKVDKIFIYSNGLRKQYTNIKEPAKKTVEGILDGLNKETNKNIKEAIPKIFKKIETKYQKTINVFQKVLTQVAAVVEEVKKCKENKLGDLLKCSVEAKMKLPSKSEVEECIRKMKTNLNNTNWDSLADYSSLNQIEKDLEGKVREAQRQIEESVRNSNRTTKRAEPRKTEPVPQDFNKTASSIRLNVKTNNEKIANALLQANRTIESYMEKYKTMLKTITDQITQNVMKMLKDKEKSCIKNELATGHINKFKNETDSVIKACYNNGSEPLEKTFREIKIAVANIQPRLTGILIKLGDCEKLPNNLNPLECVKRLFNSLPSTEEVDNLIKKMFENIEAITKQPLTSKSCLKTTITTISKMTEDLNKKVGDLCDSKKVVFEEPTLL